MGRPKKVYSLSLNGVYIAQGTLTELSVITGEKIAKLRYDLATNDSKRGTIAVVNLGAGDFALYREDELIVVGTAEELAKKRNVSVKAIKFYSTPAYRSRVSGGRKYYKLKEIGVEHIG